MTPCPFIHLTEQHLLHYIDWMRLSSLVWLFYGKRLDEFYQTFEPAAVCIKILHWLILRIGLPAVRDKFQRLWKTVIHEILSLLKIHGFIVWAVNLQQHWIWLTIDLSFIIFCIILGIFLTGAALTLVLELAHWPVLHDSILSSKWTINTNIFK